MPIKGYNDMINKNECSNYLPPCATKALTSHIWSPSIADRLLFSINKQVLFVFKRQELTFAMLPRPSPISVPDCSFRTCGIAVSSHVKVSYALYATRKGYYQCSPFYEPRT